MRLPLARGSALLAVLWLSAALAAIAFSLSSTVRGETERTSTAVDGLRSYYLASGAIERASLELLWTVTKPGQTQDSARLHGRGLQLPQRRGPR